MAQLLWGWLEFPVSFLTHAGRKVQSYNNSGGGRTDTERSQWGGVVTGREEGGLTGKQSFLPKIFRWKMSKGSFVPDMLNVFQKMNRLWYALRSYVQAVGSWSNFPLKSPISQPALLWGYFMYSTRFEPYLWKWRFSCYKEKTWIVSDFFTMEHQDPGFQ